MENDDDIYNADELNTPDWMNSDFFETVLKTAKKGEFRNVLDFKIEPATKKGDHYGSVMFRAKVKYLSMANDKYEISMIIKIMPELDGAKKDLLSESPIFETEIDMLSNVIPRFHEMLQSVGDDTLLSAKILYHTLSPKKVIVLEDLSQLGFTAIGTRMCTLEEAKMAIKKLAKWHACSYVLNNKTAGGLQKYTNDLFSLPDLENNPIFAKGAERLADLARKTPQLQMYADKLDKIKHMVLPKTKKVYNISRQKCHINILNHGDFHAKNLMFKFNNANGLAEEVMLVDFQICSWGAAAIDLIYFCYMTMEGEIREVYRDELVYFYFSEFQSMLKKLKYNGKMPRFIELEIDMLTVNRMELYLATTFLPFMCTLMDKQDMTKFIEGKEDQEKMYQSERYIKDIELVLKRLLVKGFLDDLVEDD